MSSFALRRSLFASGSLLITLAATAADRVAPIDPADVSRFREHATVLASPFMEGRLPGTAGMERAMDYMQMHFAEAGLEPAFTVDGAVAWRQAFELGGTVKLVDQSLSVTLGDERRTYEQGTDFEMTGFGTGGDLVDAPMVFVGYAISEGPDGWSSFGEEEDLTGKVAVMYRFEPMDEEGKSLWSTRGPWSGRAGFNGKIRSVAERNAAAVVIVNTPGADDERVNQLTSRGARITDRFPVFFMSMEAGSALLEAADAEGRTALELRRLADAGGGSIPLEGTISIAGEVQREPVFAENVGGLLPGKGDLADELVVVGAHLDHLGTGEFGSRRGAGSLHPGADDNASGSAGIIMLAEALKADYDAMPEDAAARSVLFLAFSAEESGLNGSRHYVENPIRAIEDHALMINFDMIGRIKDERLSVSGMNTGEGMREWLEPIAEASELEVVMPERMSGASDHTSFSRRKVPVLFGIIADFHGDYHTPDDTVDKLNFEGGAKTVGLFRTVIREAATRPERFAYVEAPPRGGGGGPAADASPLARIKVRVGIRPAQSAGEPGVLISEVTPESAAEAAGLLAGDLIVRWNKDPLEDGQQLIEKLLEHEPGDAVEVMFIRDGEERTTIVKLRPR